jgi:hypothetical protein
MTDFDPAFVKKFFGVPQRKGTSNVKYHGQADDLGLVLNDLKGERLVIPEG